MAELNHELGVQCTNGILPLVMVSLICKCNNIICTLPLLSLVWKIKYFNLWSLLIKKVDYIHVDKAIMPLGEITACKPSKELHPPEIKYLEK